MKGYLVANVSVGNEQAYEAYRSQVEAIIARHGGRYLVRGGAVEVLEREQAVSRLVIVEFPGVEAVRAFYDSPEYQEIIPLRTNHSVGSLAIVAGV